MNETFLARPLNVLLVEDNEADVMLTQEAFEDAEISIVFEVARDGQAALDVLDEAADGKRQLPELILLDLNLPKVDGLEVLHRIKTHPTLKVIPVVVMTVSTSPGDLRAAYQHHANSFIPKPTDPRRFVDVARAIERYWASVVRLPSRT